MRRLLLGLLFILCSTSFAQTSQVIYRSFWSPLYHGQRLDYCFLGDHDCGKVVADSYCKLMGYQRSAKFIKGYNVGLTNYLEGDARCQGWTCNGFKMIKCLGTISHKNPTSYTYRLKEFVLPRYNNYRIAWCNVGKHNCGKSVATSFCKLMGYLRVQAYKIQHHVLATKTLKEQALCFGPQCDGFASIICYR